MTLDELKDIPLVLRERGSGTLDAIEMALSEQGIKLSSMNVRLYLGSTESIKQFLRNSSTMGIISLQAMLKELREGEFKIIDINGLQIKDISVLCVLRDRRKLRLPILSVLYKAI